MHSDEAAPSIPKSDIIEEKPTDVDKANPSVEKEPQHDYPKPLILGLVVTTLCIATFLCGLDQTIVATAAPKITKSFNALGDIAWWTSAYL